MVSECSYLTDYTCEEGRLFWLNTINFRGKVKTDTFSINTNIFNIINHIFKKFIVFVGDQNKQVINLLELNIEYKLKYTME